MWSVYLLSWVLYIESSWNVMAHGDAREGNWRGNWRMEWVASTLHTTSEHGISSIKTITTADAHTLAASSRLNWRPRWFKWTRPFRRKTKSGFCAWAITFQTQSTCIYNEVPVFVHCCQERHVHVSSVLIMHAGICAKRLLTSFFRSYEASREPLFRFSWNCILGGFAAI